MLLTANFHTSPRRYGARNPLRDKRFPYLHTFHTSPLACERARRHAHIRAHAGNQHFQKKGMEVWKSKAAQGNPQSTPHPYPSKGLEMDKVNIDQLRQDMKTTANREAWSNADFKEVGASIKAAIDADDQQALRVWAKDMAWYRELDAYVQQRRQGATERIRARLSAARAQ